jgi:hypothetical protein
MPFKVTFPDLGDYQRKWRRYSVDKNLKDDWLVRLNNLHLFYVTSVCEGHYTCDDAYPGIALFAKREVFDRLEKLFVDREWLSSVFDGIVESDTRFAFSNTVGVSNDPNSIMVHNSFTPIKLSFTRNDPRESLLLDDKTSEWFDASVRSIERIDDILHAKLATESPVVNTGSTGVNNDR